MLRIAAVLSSLLLLAACNWSDTYGGPTIKGSGNLKTETRVVEKFTAIVISGSANLEIEQTGEESLELTVDDNLLPLFTTEVRDGTLFIGVAEGKRLTWTSGKATAHQGHSPRNAKAQSQRCSLRQSHQARHRLTVDLDLGRRERQHRWPIRQSVDHRQRRWLPRRGRSASQTCDNRRERRWRRDRQRERGARRAGVRSRNHPYVGSPKLQSRVSGAGTIEQKFITH